MFNAAWPDGGYGECASERRTARALQRDRVLLSRVTCRSSRA